MMMNKRRPPDSKSEKLVARIRSKAQNLFLSRELMCSEQAGIAEFDRQGLSNAKAFQVNSGF